MQLISPMCLCAPSRGSSPCVGTSQAYEPVARPCLTDRVASFPSNNSGTVAGRGHRNGGPAGAKERATNLVGVHPCADPPRGDYPDCPHLLPARRRLCSDDDSQDGQPHSTLIRPRFPGSPAGSEPVNGPDLDHCRVGRRCGLVPGLAGRRIPAFDLYGPDPCLDSRCLHAGLGLRAADWARLALGDHLRANRRGSGLAPGLGRRQRSQSGRQPRPAHRRSVAPAQGRTPVDWDCAAPSREGPRTLSQLLLPDRSTVFGHVITAFNIASGVLANLVLIAFIALFTAASPQVYRRGI